MLYVFTYMQNLKNKTNQREIDSQLIVSKEKRGRGKVKQMKGVELQTTNKSQGI